VIGVGLLWMEDVDCITYSIGVYYSPVVIYITLFWIIECNKGGIKNTFELLAIYTFDVVNGG
jgi:hypothetical protein